MATIAARDRAALAHATLRRAERDLGVRSSAALPSLVRPGRQRDKHAVDQWPVHGRLVPLLPDGQDGLRHGAVVSVQGSTGLLLALLAGPSQAGAWSAVVGHPDLGLLAAYDAGVNLDRLVLVPAPGPDAASVVAALLDGLDLVVVGPATALSGSDRRRLGARARERSAILVAAGDWPGAHLTLTGKVGSWGGLDAGSGWLRRRSLLVERAGRAGADRPLTLEIEMPLGADPLTRCLLDVPEAPVRRSSSVPSAGDERGMRLVG